MLPSVGEEEEAGVEAQGYKAARPPHQRKEARQEATERREETGPTEEEEE